ncbi:MAG: WGR domain-containing protein [Deltaproteobacteria bacterium]|nr:WGR domain-containing protein [Deltaproteobacteria bacterium]
MITSPIELRHVDHARNRYRVYRLSDAVDLFGARCLLIEWGRLGQSLRSRLEPFHDDAARDARRRELVELRQRHGYTS